MIQKKFHQGWRGLFLLASLFFTFFCSAETKEDNDLVLGLALGQNTGRTEALRFVTDYNGNWDTGFTFDSNGQLTGTPTGRWILSTNPDGSGSIISSSNPSSFDDTTYRILSFNTATRQLFYQNTPGTNNFSASTFGRIDFTPVLTTGCERSATKCFYFCERVFGQTTLAAAQASTLTSNTAGPTQANSCATSRFTRALYRADNSTWSVR